MLKKLLLLFCFCLVGCGRAGDPVVSAQPKNRAFVLDKLL